MKKTSAVLSLVLAASLCAASLSACGTGRSTQLAAPNAAEKLSYEELTADGLDELRASLGAFSAEFSAAAYSRYEDGENFTVSPITAYMALSMAAACAGGETREELLSALKTSYRALESNFGDLYRSVSARVSDGMGQAKLSGSLWLNEGTQFNRACVDLVAEKFYGYSYAADFAHDNGNANLAVQNFVKQHTNKLINQNFQLPADTVFALVSTLWLKDTWDLFGKALSFSPEPVEFAPLSGETKTVKLLEGYHVRGRVYEGETFTHFYTETEHGFKLKFFLPKEGYTAAEIFTPETIAEVNGVDDYNADDDVNFIHYYTRCLFPEFSASFNGDVRAALEEMGVRSLFAETGCDFTPLTPENIWCREALHAAKLTVNKRGIEGAAVFVLPGAGAAGPDGYETAYEDFVVSKTFGFLLTDREDVPLFSGVVGNV